MDKIKIHKIVMKLPKLNPALFKDIKKFGLSEGIIFYITYLRYAESIHLVRDVRAFDIEQEIYLQMWQEFTFEGKMPTHRFDYIDLGRVYVKYYYLICVERQRDRDQYLHNLSTINNFIKQVKLKKNKEF